MGLEAFNFGTAGWLECCVSKTHARLAMLKNTSTLWEAPLAKHMLTSGTACWLHNQSVSCQALAHAPHKI